MIAGMPLMCQPARKELQPARTDVLGPHHRGRVRKSLGAFLTSASWRRCK